MGVQIMTKEDTPNPFVAKQFSPERSKQLSKEIQETVGQNTVEELNKRLGNVSTYNQYERCPNCGRPINGSD